jgi:DNA processing protein
MMGWNEPERKKRTFQREFFPETNEVEKKILELLRKDEDTGIDELTFKSGLSSSNIASGLLNLEMQGVLKVMPGKRFRTYD